MLTKYRIRSQHVPELAYYLFVSEYNEITKLWYSVPDKYFIRITPATAHRFLKIAVQHNVSWKSDSIVFEIDKKEKALSDETETKEEVARIEEIIATLPVEYKGIGPYSEDEMEKS